MLNNSNYKKKLCILVVFTTLLSMIAVVHVYVACRFTMILSNEYGLPFITHLVYSILPFSWLLPISAGIFGCVLYFNRLCKYYIVAIYFSFYILASVAWLSISSIGLYIFHLIHLYPSFTIPIK